MIEFRMPSLGADMEAGTLVEWLKKPGDPVHRGDIIAVVDTQKGAIEVEVYDDGVIDRETVSPGEKVPVGTVLALIREAEGSAPARAASGEPPAASTEPPAPRAPVATPAAADAPRPLARVEPAAPVGPGARRRISPAARRAAEGLAVDLTAVDGTGPGGSVTRADVERAATAAPPPADAGAPLPTHPASQPPGTAAPPAPVGRTAAMRAAIAATMSRSKREIPHLYLSATIDMSRPLAWLVAENQQRSVTGRLLPVVLLLKAVGRAATDVPGVNGFWVEGGFRPGQGIHVGCAIALRDGGLVAPAIHDIDRKGLDTIMGELLDLIARARAGTLRSSELADPTITVTNLGDLGVESAFGIIHPPQVALVAFGRVVERPWVVDGRIEARPLMTATLSADHRAVDGRRAGLFLDAVQRWLQRPEAL